MILFDIILFHSLWIYDKKILSLLNKKDYHVIFIKPIKSQN